MEETSGPVIHAPFGEGAFSDLIRHWLDEGDRLSASAADIPAPSPASESRLRQVVQRLQPVVARHRLFVFAGIGVLSLALILATNRGAPAGVPATVASALPLAAPAAAESRPAPRTPARVAPTPVATMTAPPATAPLASARSAEPQTAPHRHHHHHHHHAASAPGKAAASARPATRR